MKLEIVQILLLILGLDTAAGQKKDVDDASEGAVYSMTVPPPPPPHGQHSRELNEFADLLLRKYAAHPSAAIDPTEFTHLWTKVLAARTTTTNRTTKHADAIRKGEMQSAPKSKSAGVCDQSRGGNNSPFCQATKHVTIDNFPSPIFSMFFSLIAIMLRIFLVRRFERAVRDGVGQR